jgi:UDP-glucose 4-epimerase
MTQKEINRAVVTGSSGFIGKHLVSHLCKLGISVLSIDMKKPPELHRGENFIEADITHDMSKIFQEGDTIFHLAANANVAKSVERPFEDFHHTLSSLVNILEHAKNKDIKVVFPSTASIYDVDNTLPLSEKSFPRPSSPYGAAKLAGESYCYSYHRTYNLDVSVIRLFNVYGPGMTRFIIFDIVKKILANPDSIELLGNGQQIRDYLYIDNVIEGFLKVAHNGKAGEDYNIASGEGINIKDLAQKISMIMQNKQIKITTSGKSWPGDISKWYACVEKAKTIDFYSTTSLDEGLIPTIESIKSFLRINS